MPEVIEPAGELGGVGAQGGDLGEGVGERLGRLRQGAAAAGAVSVDRADPDLGERVLQETSSIRSLAGPGALMIEFRS